MKIEHTTYHEARKGKPSRPTTVISSSRNPSNTVDDRPTTRWPSTPLQQLESAANMTSYPKRMDRAERKQPESKASTPYYTQCELREMARREAKRQAREHAAGPSSDTGNPHSRSISKRGISQKDSLPSRKPKIGLGGMMRGLLGSSKTHHPRTPPEDEYRARRAHEMEKLDKLQRRMRQGKLEKVIPPRGSFPYSERHMAPPQGMQTSYHPPSPTSPRSRKPTSPGTRLRDLFDTGAAVLHGTGHGVASKLSPTFERDSKFHRARLGRNSRRHSNTSDLSFECAGPNTAERLEKRLPDPPAMNDLQRQESLAKSTRALADIHLSSAPPMTTPRTPNERQFKSAPPTGRHFPSRGRSRNSENLSRDSPPFSHQKYTSPLNPDADSATSLTDPSCQECRDIGIGPDSTHSLCNRCKDKQEVENGEWTSHVSSSESEWWEDGVKPTPPLKDGELLKAETYRMEEAYANSKQMPVTSSGSSGDRTTNWVESQVLLKGNYSAINDSEIGNSERAPNVTHPVMQLESRIAVQAGLPGRDTIAWSGQTPEMKAEYDKLQELLKKPLSSEKGGVKGTRTMWQ